MITLFVILLVCSFLYYQQRLLFTDTGWTVFSILNKSNFVFGEYRYRVLEEKLFHSDVDPDFMLSASQIFTHRLDTLDQTVSALQKGNIHKAIIIKNPETDKDFLMDWPPVESLLYSSIKGGRQVTFKIIEEKDILPITADSFYSCFNRASYKQLNSYYFKIATTPIIPGSTL